jgi:hypothetical protein
MGVRTSSVLPWRRLVVSYCEVCACRRHRFGAAGIIYFEPFSRTIRVTSLPM